MDLTAYRAEFPIAGEFAFLNHASVSPYGRRVAAAVQAQVAAMQDTPFERLRPGVVALGEELRAGLATLINAERTDEIVPMPNTATGINAAANSLPLRAGDNVLVLEGDYPANIYPWLNLAPRGILVKMVPQHEGGLDLGRLAARIDARTRAIALSTVQFASGFRNDLEAVGGLCREHDLYFVVDAIQSLGAFPLDVRACNIDFLACGAQKWLLAAPGGGFLYCRRERLPELQLGAYVGTLSTVDPLNFLDYNFTLQDSAERFNLGTTPLLAVAALHASLGLLQEVGIDRIAARILALTDLLADDLVRRGYAIRSNWAPEHRSGIVIVEVPEPQAACARLLDAGVVTSARGAGLRVAPHFYNSEEDVLRVGEALDAL